MDNRHNKRLQLLDGINGLASGLAVIIGITLAVFAFNSGAALGGGVIVIAIGAICGFLPYNLKRKADIFLGDGGSGFLGFFLSAMSIHIEWGGTAEYNKPADARNSIFHLHI